MDIESGKEEDKQSDKLSFQPVKSKKWSYNTGMATKPNYESCLITDACTDQGLMAKVHAKCSTVPTETEENFENWDKVKMKNKELVFIGDPMTSNICHTGLLEKLSK